MNLTAMLILAGSIATASAQVPERAGFTLPEDMGGQTVLYVGAHPDDEWGVAPILADACLDRGARCHFLVLSEARSGGCLFTVGLKDFDECSRVRREEMARSAALFGAQVEFLGLDDLFYSFNGAGRQRVIGEWAAQSGGRGELVGRLLASLREQRPSLLFTFDPRHGSTCHAAHLSTAELILEAVARLPASQRPAVWLEQTDEIEERSKVNEQVIAGLGYPGWPDTAGQTVWYDANHRLKNGRTAYDYALQVRRTHASQFPDEASGKKVSSALALTRQVPLAPLPATIAGEYCTALRLQRPTLDIPGNREKLEALLKSTDLAAPAPGSSTPASPVHAGLEARSAPAGGGRSVCSRPLTARGTGRPCVEGKGLEGRAVLP